MAVSAIYVHIPFCRSKCNYCDFTSYVQPPSCHAAYVAALRQEIAQWQQREDLSAVKSIYFGGGTPTALKAEQLAELLRALLASGAEPLEVTVEANPETVDAAYLTVLREAGFNRLSLGAQSFNAQLLRDMGRIHGPEKIGAAVAAARAAGFTNCGVDLIYGLPGQTLAMWREDLAAAAALQTEHLSLYSLQVAEDTPWGRAGVAEAEEELSAQMLELAMDYLPTVGLRQYEIANFARPGCESRHNSAYWQRLDYLGLGAAAASCLGAHRWRNTDDLADYAAAVAAGRQPLAEEEQLSEEQVRGEAMFLGLRLLDGVDAAAFAARYGHAPQQIWGAEIDELLAAGLLVQEAGKYRLTRSGLLLGNYVFEHFV